MHDYRPEGVPDTSYVRLYQILGVFSSDQAAMAAFQERDAIYTANPQLFQVQELQSYQSSADYFQYVCEDRDVGGELKVCEILQVHANRLSHINVGIDGQDITREQVEQIIERVDTRLSAD